MFRSSYRKNVTATLILAFLLGFVGGIAGLYTILSLSRYSIVGGILSELTGPQQKQNIIVQEPGQVNISFEDTIEQVTRDSNKRLATVYTLPRVRATEPFLTDNFIEGYGVAITNDGWFVTSKSIFTESLDTYLVDVHQTNKPEGYDIDKLIIDKQSELAFFKISVGQEIPISRFRTPLDPFILGEAFIIQIGKKRVLYSTLEYIDDSSEGVVRSSELPYLLLHFTIVPDALLPGSLVYDLEGRLAGMYGSDKNIYSLNWEKLFTYVLNNEPIQRPYLGVNYFHVDDLVGVLPEDTPHTMHGAWLKDFAGVNAFERESPLLDTSIDEGDIITAVEEESITQDKTLTDLISQYSPNDVITLTVISPSLEERDIHVQLGSY